jgi:hypothetical protein
MGVEHPPRTDRSNGSLADDCEAIACLLHSGEPFLIGRPSMGSEVKVAHAAYVLGREAPEVPELGRVAGVVVSRGATATEYGRRYGAAIARSDLASTHAFIGTQSHSAALGGTRRHSAAHN